MANETEYPIILSKLDPLVVRVNELLLVVGSTSFSAKIKLGTSYSGFYVHASGLGEPIAKIEVSVKNYNNKDIVGDTGKTMAWLHIEDQASKWMDNFQESFTKASSQKNVVDLIRELKAQLHYDFTGEEPSDTTINIDTQSSYFDSMSTDIHSIDSRLNTLTERLDGLANKVDTIVTALTSTDSDDNSISYRLSLIEAALGTDTNDRFGKVIAKAITDGLTSLTNEMITMNTNINTVNTNVNTVKGTVNTVNTNVNTVKNDVGTVKNDVGTVKNDVGTVKNDVGTVKNDVGTVKSTVNTIHNTDVPDIKSTVTGSGGTTDQAVTALSNTVDTINGTVNSINSTVGGVSSTVNSINSTVGSINTKSTNTWSKLNVLDTQALNDRVCGSDSYVTGNDTDGYYVRTELTQDDMITGSGSNKRVKADTN